ncbi:MAG TPA: uroporphyrinogen decarboxylase family protein, partial [Planctomycetota bacterium]|nr:uroporphyrinogen decarboxylase family protein [Planctomycetota bacterium]
KPHLYSDALLDPARFKSWAQQHAAGEAVVWLTIEGFYWFPRTLFGIEAHVLSFYDQPDLMHRMNADLAAYHLRMLERWCRDVCFPDFITFAEDLSYNHGPMLSRKHFDQFLVPYYARIVPWLRDRGIVPIVDSDGDLTHLLGWFEAAGIEGVLPLERMANNDVAVLRQRHSRMKMIGAFDKMVMKNGEAAMRAEFERLLPVMRLGGFIPSVDHQTPPDVSLATYRVYVQLLREFVQKAVV